MFNPDCMAGRTPYRVTSDELKKDQLPSQVELVSIDGLFDKSRVQTVKQAEGTRTDGAPSDGRALLASLAEEGGRPRDFGTTRVFRAYQQEGPEQVQLSRIDWELSPPYKLDGQRSWLRDEDSKRGRNPGPPCWRIASRRWTRSSSKTSAKGSSPRSSSTPCLVCPRPGPAWPRSLGSFPRRFWDPPWLKRLADRKVNIRLVFYSEAAMRQVAAVPTWVTANGKVTQEAIEALRTTAEKVAPSTGRVLVAVNLAQLRTVVLDATGVRENWTCYAQPDPNPNESNLAHGRRATEHPVRRANLRHVAGVGLWGSLPLMETKVLLGGGAERHGEMDGGRIQSAPDRPGVPVQAKAGQLAGRHARPNYRLGVIKQSRETPEELHQVGEITQFQAEAAVKNWKRAMEDLGVLQDPAAKLDYLQGWRATPELKDYVCCDPSRRRTLASLRDAVGRFNPKHTRRPLTALLAARPGAGKSFFVQSLATTLQTLRVLSFNITTMTRREDLLACFDQIVTTQSQPRDAPLLVFFDEINAYLENHPVYHVFPAPLEDGYYLRGGIKFLIQPCIWLFAGTALPTPEICADSKGSDFISRLSFGEVDLTSQAQGGFALALA